MSCGAITVQAYLCCDDMLQVVLIESDFKEQIIYQTLYGLCSSFARNTRYTVLTNPKEAAIWSGVLPLRSKQLKQFPADSVKSC